MSKPVDKLEFWANRIKTAVSEHYAVYVANEVLWGRINKAHEKIIKELITNEDKVLDAGCAYGRSSVFFNPENYTGVDFSPEFIANAKKKYPNNDFMVGNLKELPFADKIFDWAFCVSIKKMVIDNLGEEEWLLMQKELKRVAKRLLILEYETPNEYEIL